MLLKVYNTASKKIEEFVPLRKGEVRMYNCGPTVYDYAHIGNFRSFCFADLLKRYLKYLGFRVIQVMNITDVGHMTGDEAEGEEDRLEKRALEVKKDPWKLAEFYTHAFFEDLRSLGLSLADHYPRATEHIPEMIKMCQGLVKNGFAYEVNGSVYFDLERFGGYGALSGNTLKDLVAGKRVEVNPEKKNPFDFALWKRDPGHIMQWDSPWGKGFPGWHIECSAMSMKYLGETLDIHTGGEDNIFPHHECEIAQSEAFTGKTFVRYWLHVRHLQVEGQKMSKSLGNFYTIRDILSKGFSGIGLRYALISAHYRQPFNFTFQNLEGAERAVERLNIFNQSLRGIQGKGEDQARILECLEKARSGFEEAMNNDLNTSKALAVLFDFIREINKMKPGKEAAGEIHRAMLRFNEVLGFLQPEGQTSPLDEEVDRLVRKREEARAAKDFPQADAIRDRLKEMGIILEDTREGIRWRRAKS